MKVNIENLVRQSGADPASKYVLTEFIGNLKELRDRTRSGDMTALADFFDLYVFDGNQ